MRILYLGLPLGALHLAAHGFPPKVVALGHPRAPGARRVRRLLGRQGSLVLGRPDLESPEILAVLKEARLTVALSWFWPRRVPVELLELLSGEAFGVHPSLLPRLRGPDPYFWTLRNREPITGVTLHRLAANYDEGNTIAQRREAVGGEDDAYSLARRLDRLSLELLLGCATDLDNGMALGGSRQDEREATWAPRPTAEDLAIVWKQSVQEILALIRAAAPFPGATARIGNHEVDVLKAQAWPEAMPQALLPGEAFHSPLGLVVRAAEGGVLLLKLRLMDGSTLHGRSILNLCPHDEP